MKARVLSDLHLDHYGPAKAKKIVLAVTDQATANFDVMILAGDVADGDGLEHHLTAILDSLTVPLLYVPGNHDFSKWGGLGVAGTIDKLTRYYGDMFQPLRWGTATQVAGQRFVGATLWYPGHVVEQLKARAWFDYVTIPDFLALWSSELVGEADLMDRLGPGDVMISHMLPHPQCIAPAWASSPTNAFFLGSKGEDLISECRPKVWIYGHTHTWGDQLVGDTRLLARPLGYPRENGLNVDGLGEACTFEL